ncbi:MAG TPA: hypothetical protein VFN38_10205, partial [Gemmatimonadaceae bacterium]|nr:hypothetical protein [Gemmatimonadaceae bacterium]
MTATRSYRLLAAAALLAATPASVHAQTGNTTRDSQYVVAPAGVARDSGGKADSLAAAKKARMRLPRYIAPAAEIQYFRPA